MKDESKVSSQDRWARFRFSVIGPLLAAPPAKGQLRPELARLASTLYTHPISGDKFHCGVSTLERWYYATRDAQDPVAVLKTKLRSDAGSHPSLSFELRELLQGQHRLHPGWSYRLHYDNLCVQAKNAVAQGQRLASYAAVRRWMKSQGLLRRTGTVPPQTDGGRRALGRREHAEVRSFEVEFVGALFHVDFHSCSRQVLTKNGQWVTPQLLAILDDKSRLCCHGQWYLAETAQNFVHGFRQAVLKRGLSRALMSDNGAAFLAAEVQEGLSELGVLHQPTLPYSAYQNAKQEVFWVPIERRLLAMLEGVKDLTLERLNEATQAWIELEYNRHLHSEIATTPLDSFLSGKNVLRDSPSAETLRRAFRLRATRGQRQSDGTLSIEGVRFELPNRFRHLHKLHVRYARWDLSNADLVDERSGTVLATLYPLNKLKNADGKRRRLESPELFAPPPQSEVAPLLGKLLSDYAACGLPPAYLPEEENA
jgi:putative transposase